MRRLVVSCVLLVSAACRGGAPESTTAAPPARATILEGGSERPTRLIVGLTPFLSESKLKREFAPLVEYLGARLGVPAELVRAKSYADVARMLASHEVHMAILSPMAYVVAKGESPDLVLLATQIADGASTYAGYIVVRDDGPLERIEDLRGRRFAFVDRNSASGYLYPLVYLQATGIRPETFFSAQTFAGNHEQAILQVLDRRADAAAVASPVLRMVQEELVDAKRLKILAKTGRIPFDAYCASPRLEQRIVDELRAGLLGLSTRTDEGRRVLAGLTAINGFVAVGDDHYDEVRRVAAIVEAGAPVLTP
jgi:phosphate/phosphite/phosphonate ABC transporter binding protein